MLDFVDAIEENLAMKAIRNYMPMQMGDVPAIWPDATLLQRLTGHKPQTDFRHRLVKFVVWLRECYKK